VRLATQTAFPVCADPSIAKASSTSRPKPSLPRHLLSLSFSVTILSAYLLRLISPAPCYQQGTRDGVTGVPFGRVLSHHAYPGHVSTAMLPANSPTPRRSLYGPRPLVEAMTLYSNPTSSSAKRGFVFLSQISLALGSCCDFLQQPNVSQRGGGFHLARPKPRLGIGAGVTVANSREKEKKKSERIRMHRVLPLPHLHFVAFLALLGS
jgi:hypothetical protein